MVNNIQYTNIRVILSNLTSNDLLQDLTLEQLVGYVERFNGLFNIPQLYEEREVEVDIHNYRGCLPCGVISVNQVKDLKDNVCIPAISGTFFNPHSFERAFKTQGEFIFTTFKEGKVMVSYNSTPLDEEGLPKILDMEKYKNALELFVKLDKFTKYFEQGKLAENVLRNTQTDYCFAAGQLSNALKMPSINEWQNISNAGEQLLEKPYEFYKGFETTGLPERYKRH